MKAEKKRRLENAGWRVSDAREFLNLTPDESAFVEINLRSRDAFGNFAKSTTGLKQNSRNVLGQVNPESQR